MNEDNNNNNLFATMMGAVSMSLSEELLADLCAARESVEDILEKLPLIYQGQAVELKLPTRENELAQIEKGLAAINMGYPRDKAEKYFRGGLDTIKRQISEISSFAGTLARDTADSFANMKEFKTEDGCVCFSIPTPACLKDFF